MKTASITYNGVPMECSYEYSPAESQTWIHPGSPAYVDISSIKIGGVEAYDLFDAEQLDRIEDKVLEAHGEQDQFDASEAADQQRQERAFEGFLA